MATEWLYHITTAERMPAIRKIGLMPSTETRWGGELGEQSFGKIYFAKAADTAIYYGMVAFTATLDNLGLAYLPILLRVPMSEVIKLTKDKGTLEDFFIEQRVKLDKVEGFWQNKWSPVRELDFIDEEMFYESTDEGFKDWEGNIVGDSAIHAEKDVRELLTINVGHLLR